MSLPTMLRALGCLAFGHAPTVQGVAGESKADYVCGRCGTALGVFVADPNRRRAGPTDGPALGGPAAAMPHGPGATHVVAGRTDRPALDRERDAREGTWLDDGGRNADPAAGGASAGIPGRLPARAANSRFPIAGNGGTTGAAVPPVAKQH